jgi:hypothetical protein
MKKIVILSLAFIFLSMCAFAGINERLIGYYSFDNCGVTDNSGNGHNGILNGNPLGVDGGLI